MSSDYSSGLDLVPHFGGSHIHTANDANVEVKDSASSFLAKTDLGNEGVSTRRKPMTFEEFVERILRKEGDIHVWRRERYTNSDSAVARKGGGEL